MLGERVSRICSFPDALLNSNGRLAELEARCLALEQANAAAAQELATVEESRATGAAAAATLQAELSDARLALAQMEQQAVTVQSLQSKLSELECEQHSSAEWAEGVDGIGGQLELCYALQLLLTDTSSNALCHVT